MADDIYVAKSGFSAYRKGTRVSVVAGETVREGHWLLGQHPEAFKPIEVDYDVPREQPAKRGPGRLAKSAAADGADGAE